MCYTMWIVHNIYIDIPYIGYTIAATLAYFFCGIHVDPVHSVLHLACIRGTTRPICSVVAGTGFLAEQDFWTRELTEDFDENWLGEWQDGRVYYYNRLRPA